MMQMTMPVVNVIFRSDMDKGDFVRLYRTLTGHYPDRRKVKSHVTIIGHSSTTEFDANLLVFDSAKGLRHFKKYSRMMDRKARRLCR